MQEKISLEQKVNSYRWYKDEKMLGITFLLITIAMQIFAWINVPFFTTIHGYTVGMAFGVFNPFFYMFVIYSVIPMIMPIKYKLPNWLKITKLGYWIIALSIIVVSVSFGYYQGETGITAIGLSPWKSFNKWFDTFALKTWYEPVDTNGGLIGAFLYSLFSTFLSSIGTIIIGIILLIVSFSILLTGSSLGLYKEFINKKNSGFRKKDDKNEETFEINSFTQEIDVSKTLEIDKEDKIPEIEKTHQIQADTEFNPIIDKSSKINVQENNNTISDPFSDTEDFEVKKVIEKSEEEDFPWD